MESVTIYCLVCPVTKEPKYIGQTGQKLSTRLSCHMTERGTTPKNIWIDALRFENKRPEIMALEVVPIEIGNEVEQKWLSILSAFNLLNNSRYTPSNCKGPRLKIPVSPDLYTLWKRLYSIGDLTELAAITGLTPAKVKYIIETRKGAPGHVEAIKDYYDLKMNPKQPPATTPITSSSSLNPNKAA